MHEILCAATLLLTFAGAILALPSPVRPEHEVTAQELVYQVRYLRADGARLGINADRIAARFCSGNVYSGLPFLMSGRTFVIPAVP